MDPLPQRARRWNRAPDQADKAPDATVHGERWLVSPECRLSLPVANDANPQSARAPLPPITFRSVAAVGLLSSLLQPQTEVWAHSLREIAMPSEAPSAVRVVTARAVPRRGWGIA